MKRLVMGAGASLAILGMSTQAAATEADAAACWGSEVTDAARVHQLDVMLMVNSLLCKASVDDFRGEYDRFLLRHRALLGTYNGQILRGLAARMGTVKAYQEIDRGTVAMANHYGQSNGFGCHDLKKLTGELAAVGGEALPQAAVMLVGDDLAVDSCPAAVALAGKPPIR
jgi:hypothetical protein